MKLNTFIIESNSFYQAPKLPKNAHEHFKNQRNVYVIDEFLLGVRRLGESIRVCDEKKMAILFTPAVYRHALVHSYLYLELSHRHNRCVEVQSGFRILKCILSTFMMMNEQYAFYLYALPLYICVHNAIRCYDVRSATVRLLNFVGKRFKATSLRSVACYARLFKNLDK